MLIDSSCFLSVLGSLCRFSLLLISSRLFLSVTHRFLVPIGLWNRQCRSTRSPGFLSLKKKFELKLLEMISLEGWRTPEPRGQTARQTRVWGQNKRLKQWPVWRHSEDCAPKNPKKARKDPERETKKWNKSWTVSTHVEFDQTLTKELQRLLWSDCFLGFNRLLIWDLDWPISFGWVSGGFRIGFGSVSHTNHFILFLSWVSFELPKKAQGNVNERAARRPA